MGHVATDAQAGVGMGALIAWMAIAFFRGVSSGAQSLVAAAHGAKDPVRIRHAADAGLWIGAVAGVVSALFVAAVVLPVLDTLVGNPGVAAAARDYLEVRLFAMPFSIAGFGVLCILQGLGDSHAGMRVNVIGNLLNGVLDVVFIFGVGTIPAMGARGAALATVVSSSVMLVLFLWNYRRVVGPIGWPRWPTMRRSLSVGVPAGIQGFSEIVAFVAMSAALARVGAAHLAASEIVLNIASLSFLPGYGISEAGGVLVGRYLGAGQPEVAARALYSARMLAVSIMAVFSVVFIVFGQTLVSWFTTDSEVIAISAELMVFAAAFQVFDAAAMAHVCGLRGAGETRFTLMAASVTAWGITVPAALILGLWWGWGATGAWIGMTFEVVALALISGYRIRGLKSGRVGRMELLLGNSNG
ncbi:MAG: MATE family efflux transporter, partial [Myxococcota bacterium]